MTFIEVLVSVVLLGLTGLAVLAALQVSVIGTKLERDHSKAYQWLQSANGVLQAADRVSCILLPADSAYATGEAKVRASYQTTIRTLVVNPPGWGDVQLKVLEPVKVWDGADYYDPAVAPKPCFDNDGLLMQQVTLQVESPDGEILETLQVVKRD